MSNQKHRDSLIWGIILIVIGGLVLLHQFGIHIWHTAWRFWPVILIVWGANKLYLGLKERSERTETPARDKDHEI